MKNKPGRIVGIDYGLARIGLAISDENKIIAFPLATITTEKKSEDTAAKLLESLNKHQEAYHCEIEHIVIGLPLMMSGKMGLLADEVKHFVEILKTLTSIPITCWDERLTTVQAERSLRESSMTRKKRAKVIDAVAAVIILQNFLDLKK
jgi:putative holliday junction resolvase